MSDFDFDELDKAVAGALGPDDTAPAQEQAPAAVPAVSQVAPTASRDEPKDEPAIPQRTALAPAARRSSGRFMDVVHPSSDMRTRTGYAPASEPVASEPRTTAFVAPSVPSVPEEKEAEDWSKPLESPFLPDAKVEKRPLGGAPGAQDFNPEELLEAPEEELKLEQPDDPRLEATTLPDPIDFATQVSEGSIQADPVDEPVTADLPTIDQLIEEPIIDETSINETPQAPAMVEEKPEEITGPTSIAQQYQEQPSDAKPSGAIYDTENYHQPMAVAPKKHGSAWGIIWIILLIILGAGAGVAFYLFVLPML